MARRRVSAGCSRRGGERDDVMKESVAAAATWRHYVALWRCCRVMRGNTARRDGERMLYATALGER